MLGHKKGFLFGERLVGVELKNDIVQFERALDQMTTFGQYTHAVYLACTPAMAAEYLDKHAEARGVHHWDSTVLRKKLESFGFGLLLVEGSTVYEVMKPTEKEPNGGKAREVLNAMAANLKVRSARA